ncbi:hypothetical protein [Paracoccus albus]|uniref:hypothetical protein n=1 Tax=Paracoccus albus TaxID=3017784 RepID=UPI0022F02459|nr:hypothetical protein [Paracoccus albus]WBU60252.1 hypothetical protein PAF20_16175 [Paracoccus albus]
MPDWRSASGPGGRALVIGAALTAIWLLMLLVFWLTSGDGTGAPGWISAVAALMPLALIWMAVGLARSVDALRAEADALRAELQHGSFYRADPRLPRNTEPDPQRAERPAQAPTVKRVQPPKPMPQQRRADDIARTTAGDPRQTSLGLDTPEAVDLPATTVIRALNFPDGPDDQEAIAALRETLKDSDQARLIRSAQDVITLLAERGIYTDELEAEAADIGAWRRFAEGQRGNAVRAVGAVRDPDMLEAATTAMRADDVFRDAVHHFLRLFDRSVTGLMPQLADDEIAWMAQTRSALAFMLLARAAGLFGQTE